MRSSLLYQVKHAELICCANEIHGRRLAQAEGADSSALSYCAPNNGSESEAEMNSGLLSNSGGLANKAVLLYQGVSVCVSPSISHQTFFIYGYFAPLHLIACLFGFMSSPQSNRFFRGRAGLWAAGEGAGQEEVGDQRIAFPCASPLPALRLSIQLLLKQHTPTWAGAIHTRLFGRGLTHVQEIHMYVMHLIHRALQIKSFLRFWLVCGCSFYTIFSPPAHTLEPTQI